MKRCTGCGNEKPESAFYENKGVPVNPCRSCSIARNKVYASERKADTARNARAAYAKRMADPTVAAKKKAQSRAYRTSVTGTARERARRLVNAAKQRSRKFGREFDLTVDDITARIEAGRCEATSLYFDLSADQGARAGARSPSIDRIDNSKGYTADNVQVVCWQFNLAKAHHGLPALVEIAQALVARDRT